MDLIIRAVVALLIVPSVLFGCSTQTSQIMTPDKIVVAFDKANKERNIDESKQYVDKEVLNAIENGRAWWIGTYTNFVNDYDKDVKKIKPIDNSIKIKGDTATVDVLVTHTNNSESKKTYYLVKQDDQWKITMDQ